MSDIMLMDKIELMIIFIIVLAVGFGLGYMMGVLDEQVK